MWNCGSRVGGNMRIAGVPSLLPVNESVFSTGGLAPITDVAEPRRLNQTAAPRRRRALCAQPTRLDLEADPGVSGAHTPTHRPPVIAHLS